MKKPSDMESLLIASTEELHSLQRRIGSGEDDDPGLQSAIAMCLAAHSALRDSLASTQPGEPTEVILARHRRRWRGRLFQWAVFVPLILIGIVLLGVVIFTLVTSFIWRG